MAEKRDVVISGIGGLFPGSGDLEQLGKNILANEYLVQREESLWTQNQWIDVEPVAGKVSLEKCERGDHTFFGLHSKLATMTDPMSRMGFERCFEAIIDAGLHPAALRGSNTRVYAGSHIADTDSSSWAFMDTSDGYVVMGHNRCMSANRVSYYFDFSGHSCAYSAGEAFGPMAINLAVDDLEKGLCDAALVVSSATIYGPLVSQMYKDMGFGSKDLFCHPFEETASGTHRSESCVAFMLQPAALAKRCYAKVVAADAMHLGNRPHFDMTLPSRPGLEAFLTNMYRTHGVEPSALAYVEADGLGQHVYDETELDALDAALARKRPPGQPLLVGSVKSNVGHTEVSSGMLGVVKAVVAMEAGVIPATINHVKDLPGAKGLAAGRMQLVTRNTELKMAPDSCVGVNTMSLVGQAGHIILKPNAKTKKRVADPGKELPRLVLLSGRSEETLVQVAEKVRAAPYDPEYIRLVQDIFSNNIRGYEFRSYVICPAEPNQPIQIKHVEPRLIYFVFSGMGSQWAGMGAALMALPLFAETIERLHAVLATRGVDLKAIVTETGPTAFDNILKSFVGITACQVALTNVLYALGVEPTFIIGHSLGELACAYADGCLTESQAILAAWARGQASIEATLIKGMMAAVGLGYQEVLPRLPPTVEVACRNSAASCTLSGPAEDVKQFVAQLSAEGVFARAVNVSDIAYHSRHIAPAAPILRRYLEELVPERKERSSKWLSTSVPLHLWDTPAAKYCSVDYQVNNMLSPVLFEEGLRFFKEESMIVEIAPHGLMQAILKRALPLATNISLTQRDHENPLDLLLNRLGSMTFHGAELDVAKLYPDVAFPVARGTPPTSSLATWVPGVRYHGYEFRTFSADNFGWIVHNNSPGMSVAGGGRVLAYSESLKVAWTVLGRLVKDPDVAVSFSDISVDSYLELRSDKLEVSCGVARGEGAFEVEEFHSGQVLLSGSVTVQDPEDPPPAKVHSAIPTDGVFLTGQEFLADLAGLGVSYTATSALRSVRIGEKEWVIRMDGACSRAAILEALLQVLMYRASEEAIGAVLLKRLRRLDMDPVKLKAQKEIVVRYNLAMGDMSGDGVYVAGFVGAEVDNRKFSKSPRSFQFVRYGNSNLQSLDDFVSLAGHLTLEGVSASQREKDCGITIVELESDAGRDAQLATTVANVLSEKMDIRVAAGKAPVPGAVPAPSDLGEGACLTVCAAAAHGEGVRVAARLGGFLMMRSAKRLSSVGAPKMALVAEQRVDGGWVSLLRPAAEAGPDVAQVLQLGRGQEVPASLPRAGPGRAVVLVWRGRPPGGVAHVVDQVRSRPYALYTRLVFILDEDAPAFSPTEPLYADQLRLRLLVNVLHRQAWGCWLQLPLAGAAPAALTASRLEGTTITAYGLNPRDRPSACSKQAWSGHLDYVGESRTGQRVMGVARWMGDSCQPRLDSVLQWPVPRDWSAADAATVPYSYAFAYHALLVRAGLRRDRSLLVHEGASPVGQAAVCVALQLGCPEVFTTVASESQRLAVLRRFPQIPAERVLWCADGSASFEWQIRRQNAAKRSRGVDVVLSALPGPQLKASLRCLKDNGTLVHYGREDMVATTKIGLMVFLGSTQVVGMTGDQLFESSEQNRRLIQAAMLRGIRSGSVKPIEGSKSLSAPDLAGIKEALLATDGVQAANNKVVVSVLKKTREDDSGHKKSYVVVGGEKQEWLQVAGWLARQGAREVVVVVAGGAAGSLRAVRHRVLALRRLFGTAVTVQPQDGQPCWDEVVVRDACKTAAKAAPVDAVVALVKDDAAAAATVHAALAKEGLSDAALLLLTASAETACALAELCEARRASGLRAACLAGPLHSAASHVADLLGGAGPAVTLLQHAATGTAQRHERPNGVPSDAQALLELGRELASRGSASCRVRELPTLGLRARHSREATPMFAVPPLAGLDRHGEAALAALAGRLIHPMMVVEGRPAESLADQAAAVAEAIVRTLAVGPYNVLGWGLGTPLALEVCRQLEAKGHKAVTMLVLGDVLDVRAWAKEQTDASLLRSIFPDMSQSLLERVPCPVPELLESLPEVRHRAHLQAGFGALRTAVHALASHAPNVTEPFQGRLVDVQAANESSFPWAKNFSFHTIPRQEVELGLRGSRIGSILMDSCAMSKEVMDDDVRTALLACS